ncbi:hypothetical protein SNK03_003499 [Fusarium graminearum]
MLILSSVDSRQMKKVRQGITIRYLPISAPTRTMHGKRKAGLRSAMQDLQQKDSDLIYEHAMAGEKRDARAVSELSWRGALRGEWLVKTALMLACRSPRLPFMLF